MSQDREHVLPNGYTFLASTAGMYGYWAKATDPITAIRECYKYDGRTDAAAIYVLYGKNTEISVSDFGGFNYHTDNPPTPLGIFYVTNRSIRPVKKGDFDENHADCLEWQKEQIDHFKEMAD